MTNILNDTRKKDYFAAVRELGRQEGDGKNSRPEYGFKTFLTAADGLLVSSKGPDDDVKPSWAEYLKGRGKNHDYEGEADKGQKSVTQQESKARQIIVIGGHPVFTKARNDGTSTVAEDFINLCQTELIALAKLSSKAIPVYDKFVTIIRAQKAKFKSGKAEPLTQEEIREAIAAKPSSPDELKDIKNKIKQLRDMAEKYPNSAEWLEAAATTLEPRVSILEVEEKEESLAKQLEGYTADQVARILEKQAA